MKTKKLRKKLYNSTCSQQKVCETQPGGIFYAHEIVREVSVNAVLSL